MLNDNVKHLLYGMPTPHGKRWGKALAKNSGVVRFRCLFPETMIMSAESLAIRGEAGMVNIWGF